MMVQWALLALVSDLALTVSFFIRQFSIWSQWTIVLNSALDSGMGTREGSRAMEMDTACEEFEHTF
jgi:hypothetical protein